MEVLAPVRAAFGLHVSTEGGSQLDQSLAIVVHEGGQGDDRPRNFTSGSPMLVVT